MPLRYAIPPSALLRRALSSNPATTQQLACHGPPGRASFHSTAPLRDDEIDGATNHYEALKLAPGASNADIKKSFYSLSKTHHPDQNRDPGASSRFVRISEAYRTLSSPEQRARYDRDVLGLSPHGGHHGRSGRGSYSSANPAGGRPATGLSRRRTTFTGPPPSFYRSGGWGAHGAKRSAAADESTGGFASGAGPAGPRDHHNDGAWAAASSSSGGSSTGFGSFGGMGPGQDPFHTEAASPHFDREGHERTGRQTEEHRSRSRRRRMVDGQEVDIEPERGATGMFFVIGGVLVLSFMGPFVVSRAWNSGEKKQKLPKDWNRKAKG
ncbi:hypothetical protein JX265_004475 [Neoarthrinium moseri]|uniref:J domain-containing protein n=1 Tax=Neoarthrinium moseri TaxID=1658444 RepID=A0A9P9WQY8_9PEZI|nr:uncharacterized protein JN550_010844 [Neoarthrinium moseri]KAI1861464.1 hypothetical protein JN550_010844 [Neoarthrinium moseri]KAI1875417.1 hypothetical protein JX265_004475 [Neoarthrinium moseri]